MPTTYDGPNINALNKIEQNLESLIEQLQEDIEISETSINSISAIISKARTNISNINIKSVTNKLQKLQDLQDQQRSLMLQITEQQRTCNEKQQKIDHLNTHQYDPNCKYCTSNIFVQDAIQAQTTINADQEILNSLQIELLNYQSKISMLTEFIAINQTYNELTADITTNINLRERSKLQQQILESDLQTRESELETCLDRQELFSKNETAIKHNETVDELIEACKSEIIVCTTDIKSIQEQIKNMYGAIEVAKTHKSIALENLEKYQQLEIEYKAYEYYLDSVKRDGIAMELVVKALPKIEVEINNVLNQIVDFNMVLNTDGKNINGYIIYDEDNYWPLELTSGMEKFIASLAIRIALINVSALPRPNFIAIDEGWGSLDAEHISAVVNLFEYFRTKFDFSIIISHVDSMRDMVDNLIEVNKINGYSKILHT